MKLALVILLTLIFPALSQAQCPAIRGNVIVFGGRGSTTAQMQTCYPDFLSLSNVEGEKYIGCLAEQIDKMPAALNGTKLIIAGHSSGAAPAERLAHKVKDKNKIRLVLLEGFGSPANQVGVETTCWYATNGKIEGMNAPYMKNPKDCLGKVKSYSAPWCNTSLCLHVALVNRNTNANLDRTNVFTDGLKSCQGTLDWVNGN